jgi:hypothetical protein
MFVYKNSSNKSIARGEEEMCLFLGDKHNEVEGKEWCPKPGRESGTVSAM